MKQAETVIRLLAALFGLLVGALYFYAIWPIRERNPAGFYLLLGAALAGGWLLYRQLTAKGRRRRRILQQSFPEDWRRILATRVDFYRDLDDEERRRFERRVQLFLGEKQISGVETEVNDLVRVLVAASAVIPIFGYPEWEYRNLQEVLIYPGAFSDDFDQTGYGRDVLGMVGEGAMHRMMILSKPDLLRGYSGRRDGLNTALHEFIHLLDASDGDYDGVPTRFLEQRHARPWVDLLERELERLRRGESDLDPYGATNEEEFFAVAGEYFFELPELLKADHPELYEALCHLFQQDPLARRSPRHRRSPRRRW